MDRLAKAKELMIEAQRLVQEDFDMRPLPDKWKIGMRVRYLKDKEWAWGSGCEGVVVALGHECDGKKTSSEYQVFYTKPVGGYGRFWTTPDEVELVV